MGGGVPATPPAELLLRQAAQACGARHGVFVRMPHDACWKRGGAGVQAYSASELLGLFVLEDGDAALMKRLSGLALGWAMQAQLCRERQRSSRAWTFCTCGRSFPHSCRSRLTRSTRWLDARCAHGAPASRRGARFRSVRRAGAMLGLRCDGSARALAARGGTALRALCRAWVGLGPTCRGSAVALRGRSTPH